MAPITWRLEVLLDALGLKIFFNHIWSKAVMIIKNPEVKQIAWIEDFGQWHADGANLVLACEKMEKAALVRGKSKKIFAERASKQIGISLKRGKSVGAGMVGLFDPQIIDLFTIGERTGTLSLLMKEYLRNIEEKKALRGIAIKRLTYPLVLSACLIVGLIAIGQYGTPALAEMIDITKLPDDAKTLMAVAEHLANYFEWYSTTLSLMWLAFQLSKNKYTGLYRAKLDRYLPLYSIHKSMVANDCIKRIALLSKSGISLNETVEFLLKSCTEYEKSFYMKMHERIVNGTGSIAEYLDVGLLEDEIFQRLSALANLEGEDAKYHAIYVAGDRSGAAAKKRIEQGVRIIQPVAWLFMISLAMITMLGAVDFAMNVDQLVSSKF
jgi:type II secretory pathway component PulF